MYLMTSQPAPLIMLKGGESSSGDTNQEAENQDKEGKKTVFKFDSYTITIVIIFGVQLMFCIGICCYTNKQVTNAKRETVK